MKKHMRKRILSLLLASVMLLTFLPMSAQAAELSGTCGADVRWTLSGGTLTISGTGPMANYSGFSDQPWVDHWTKITAVVIENGVTSIGNSAFPGYLKLASVSIPNSVTSIGDLAFFSCESLTSVNIPDGVISIGFGAFSDCTGLTSVTIPGRVASIESQAFSGCTNLSSVTIQKGIAKIGDSAFQNCSNLTSINIPDSVISIGVGAFLSCTRLASIDIPDSVTLINAGAFKDCHSLTSVNIPEGVTYIAASTFYGCNSLTSVSIPQSVVLIDKEAFVGCQRLQDVHYGGSKTQWEKVKIEAQNDLLLKATIHFGVPDTPDVPGTPEFSGMCGENVKWSFSNGTLTISGTGPMKNYSSIYDQPWDNVENRITKIIIEDGVTRIGDYAFPGCDSLINVSIPDSVTSIGSSAFMSCDNLTGVNIPDSVISIGSSAFAYCESINSIIIPGSATSIETSTFHGCINLKNVIMLDGIIKIGAWAFQDCSSLASVSIPNGVTEIGISAFGSCISLTSVDIPDSVTRFHVSVFENCRSLTSVSIPEGITSISNGIFSGCSNLTSVNIPQSVRRIDEEAFLGCQRLSDVYYGGSMSQWGRIDVAAKNDPLLKATIHFAPVVLTLNANGGKLAGADKVTLPESGKLEKLPDAPSYEGYKFLGWFTAAEGGTAVTLETVFEKDATIYAHWEKEVVPVTLTLNANGGKLAGADKVTLPESGKLEKLPDAPSYEGYKFLGWFTAAQGGTEVTLETVFEKDATIYAHWEKEVVPVVLTLNANGGKLAGADKVTLPASGKLEKLPDAPSYEGYKFLGWFTAAEGGTAVTLETVFEKDATIYAHWEKEVVPVTLTLNANGGKLAGADKVTLPASGKLEKLPDAPSYEGYKFLGWFTAAEGGTAVTLETVFEKDATIYAHWEKEVIPVVLTLNANGGKLAGADKVTLPESGKLEKLPDAPSYEGYKFLGWFTAAQGGTEVTLETVFEKDATIYAHWEKEVVPVVLTLNANGGKLAGADKVTLPASGKLEKLPDAPSYEGYKFLGWFTAAQGGTEVTLETVFEKDATIYAHWEKETVTPPDQPGGPSGPSGPSNPGGSGTPSIPSGPSAPSGPSTPGTSGTPSTPGGSGAPTTQPAPFGDVSRGDWYYDAVAYAAENGLMNGTSDSTFAPGATTTRAMIVTILFRLENSPSVSGVSFGDVEAGSWYAEAVAWAAANGIVSGYGDGSFGANDAITREQLAAILYRYASYKGYDVGELADLGGYSDAAAVDDWALSAMRWANHAGLISGRTATTLVPGGTATRAEVAAILMRFCQNVAGMK